MPAPFAPMPSAAASAARPRRRARRAVLTALAVATCLGMTAAWPASADPTAYQETYRPQVHFSPARNWMNDPNGLIFYKGVYHLFFQYNPLGTTWGNMSWGHATSPDLVHWTQQPLAIPQDDQEMIFSGSVVFDRTNSSGLGTSSNPPLVAVYTSAYKTTGRQAQSLAYSTDGGTTWTKYRGNPVLDIASNDFRDPKVFWYAPTHSWRMVVALASQYQIRVYSSPDLKHWTAESDFGPAGSTGGFWECPDLFPLNVDGDPHHVKWVLVVNTAQAPAGGTGAQYFIGDFDGRTFTPDEPTGYTPPPGTLLQGFEAQDFGDWTVEGNAFGSGPAAGTLPGQQTVTGYTGSGLANSFHDFDNGTGSLTSPPFTIDQPYLNFQVGGGRHPYVAGSGDGSAPTGDLMADFEGDTYGDGWTATGDFAGTGPKTEQLDGSLGAKVLDTWGQTKGDGATGTVSSPPFTITRKYLDFLIAGGNHPWSTGEPTAFNLVVDGKVVRTATGKDSGSMDWTSWDVSDLVGRTATVQAVDGATGGWGHLIVDDVVQSDQAARPKDRQTTVNLVVDGQVVRSTTGADSEALDWASWKLDDLRGKQARIQLVDHSTGGWGHVLADQFTFAAQPALSMVRRAHWVDHGADYYATTSFNDVPSGRRVQLAWMNNWTYGQNIPTSPWRSADAFPRELTLRTVDGRPQLVQQPVGELAGLRQGEARAAGPLTVTSGSVALPGAGSPAEIAVDFVPGTAATSGIDVRTGNGQRTRIGYDAAAGELFVDRTRSGDVSFHDAFPAVHRAPLALTDGHVRLRLVVDASSVEVYTADGQLTFTDQIFPDPASTGVDFFADGGTATLSRSKIWALQSGWTGPAAH